MKPGIETPVDPLQGWEDRTLPAEFVAVMGSSIALGLLMGTMGAYFIMWWESPISMLRGMSLVGMALGLVVILIGIVLHEGLHAFGFLLGGGAPKHIKFGIMWAQGMPHAHCEVPLRVSSYRIALALPAFVLGVVPIILGFATHSVWLTGFGAVLLSAAAGDFMILWSLRSVHAQTLVRDHPTKPGFQIAI